MDIQPPNYRHEYATSRQHLVFGLLTIGLGFIIAHPLALLVGATLYALGWIYIPDLPFFRRAIDAKYAAAASAEEAKKVAEFVQRRDALVTSLTPDRRRRYAALANVCADIESASASDPLGSAAAAAPDPRLRKLDELMWTYLRLLGIEESLEKFLETERRENLPALLTDAEGEAKKLAAEVDDLKAHGPSPALESRTRYLGSRLERLEVLRKRQQRIVQGQENLQLVVSEQERLDQQIKLIRADAVATKNAEALTARIDATVEHLDQTNKWLAEMDQFKDMVADMPVSEIRVGYATPASATSAAPEGDAARRAARAKVSQ